MACCYPGVWPKNSLERTRQGEIKRESEREIQEVASTNTVDLWRNSMCAGGWRANAKSGSRFRITLEHRFAFRPMAQHLGQDAGTNTTRSHTPVWPSVWGRGGRRHFGQGR